MLMMTLRVGVNSGGGQEVEMESESVGGNCWVESVLYRACFKMCKTKLAR